MSQTQPRATYARLSPYDLYRGLQSGTISAELYHQLRAVSAERERLTRANAALASRVEVLEAIHQSDRAALREALTGRVQRWRLWMWDKPSLWQGVTIGFVLGAVLVTVAYEIVRWCM